MTRSTVNRFPRQPSVVLVAASLLLLSQSTAAENPPPAEGANRGETRTTLASAAARPRLSRTALSELKKYERQKVFAALGSFDERGLADEEFILQAAGLLDPQRIPGLAEACASGDSRRVLECVARACRSGRGEAEKPTLDSAARAAADDALQNRFRFYGEQYQLPEDIDWDFNPGTAHWGHDLNRFSFLSPLTQAFLATDDPRYGRKAVALILDWIGKADASRCFAGTRYVWGSYLNNAIHCQAWCRCLTALLARGQVEPLELLRVLKSVHDQLAYLEIVTNGHAGNWPTIGCQGMLDCLAAFPVFRDTDRFVDYCVQSLKAQIAEQVLPDGVQDELTPHYHRVVVRNLLTAVRSLRTLKRELDPETMATLRKMVHYVQQTAVPDGSKQVAFNDSDPGSPGDLRPALESLGLADFLSPPERLGPEVFPFAGVALLRQRPDRGDLYLAFDAGPYGRSHQHEDKLGFWLYAYGRSFLVDPGRHLYDTSPRSYYPYLKTTAAHSTIRIDGQGQHSAGRRGSWIAKQSLDLGWSVRDGEVRASGVYDLGYGKENAIAVVHRREIVFVQQRCWVVFDVVEGEGEHLVESRFQFAPGPVSVNGAAAHTDYDDANLLLRVARPTCRPCSDIHLEQGQDNPRLRVARPTCRPCSDIRLEQGQDNPRGGWYSDSYGKIEPAPALSLSVRTLLPWRAATLLFPYRGKQPPEVDFTFYGHAVRIQHPDVGEVSVSCSLP